MSLITTTPFVTDTLRHIFFQTNPFDFLDRFLPFQTLVLQPLARLYILGPTWLGMWGGRSPHDICAQITQTNSKVWMRNEMECFHIISKAFYSHVIVIKTLGYLFGLWWILRLCFRLLRNYFHKKRWFWYKEKQGGP